MRLRHTESGNFYNFNHNGCDGYKPDGTTGTGTDFKWWQDDQFPYSNSAANSPYETAMVDWAEIHMPIWGATQNPSSVEVSIIRFVDPDVQPLALCYDAAAAANYNPYPEPASTDITRFDKFQKFWATHVDNTNGNFIKKVDYQKLPSGFRVLKRQVFQFNPTSTYENDTAGHQKIFKLFMNINEVTSYVGQDDRISQPSVSAGANINTWPTSTTLNNQLPVCGNPKARLFLMIRGQTASVDPGNDPAQAPSFDLMIRRKYTVIA